MTTKTPPLDARSADAIVAEVEEDLVRDFGWQGQAEGAGAALVHLFGRLAELVTTRLNRVPEKHFLAFLNEAGVDLLSPRPAGAILTFIAADDEPEAIGVPAGTQVATVQTETLPEVIFETQRDIVVVPNTLLKCVAFDPLAFSDCSADVQDLSTSFAVFQGATERLRWLYIGDDALFAFADDATRAGATITLRFEVQDQEAGSADWQLVWEYYDEEAADWRGFSPQTTGVTLLKGGEEAGVVEVVIAQPPKFGEYTITDGAREWTNRWVRIGLTGGTNRRTLPIINTITGKSSVTIEKSGLLPDQCYYNPIESSAYVPLDLSKELYPFGTRPRKHDTFYVAADEPLSKPGAQITVSVEIEEIAAPGETVELVWEYYDGQKWQKIDAALGLTDDTAAFAAEGTRTVSFTLPDADHATLKPPQAVAVNEEEHRWLRVRILGGLYGTEGYWDEQQRCWVPEALDPPILKELTLGYSYSPTASDDAAVAYCLAQVDSAYTDYTTQSQEAGETFAPFSAAEEGPACYLGFQKPFPAGKWMQILLDVDEDADTGGVSPSVYWEYWNGIEWAALRVSDGSQGLSERGYLGFFGPEDHASSAEFGQSAYWLRARPQRSPVADPGTYEPVVAEGNEASVTLDASLSQVFDRQSVAKYIWRSVSSTHLEAKGEEVSAQASGGAVTAAVTLDGSGSTARGGRTIAKYIWRQKETKDESGEQTGEDKVSAGTPYLRVIRLNTVPALNAETIGNEVLGASDGKPDQAFTLLKTPVLPGVQIAVREPDRPPADELNQLEKELQQEDETAEALLSQTGAGDGVWVRWCRVSDFYGSTSSSRHFTLDSTSGEVCFGDGERGKIPPIGRDNVKAVQYQTHGGASGNAKIGGITVLRNPSGDLADIKSVTNPEAAAGGSDAETVDEVKARGPQSLKHRQRAVTVEDFMWLALESSGEIAQARCLPTSNTLGLHEAGWVTVVITPESEDAKPTPSTSLLRYVQDYLEDRALANLKKVDQIHVKGPEYIEATVLARVIPSEPEKSDEIELAILDLLETFLHPLKGGPERVGWDLGRDVYLSEVCAEIEGISGVDHVASVRLLGSLQQYRLRLGEKDGAYRPPPFEVPVGSQVSTFDERIKLLLAETLTVDEVNPKVLKQLDVYGFKVGDEVTIVAADNAVVVSNLTIASISGDDGSCITFEQPFEKPVTWVQRDALMSADGHLRLPLRPLGEGFIEDSNGEVVGMRVRGFQPDDKVSVVVGTRRHPDLEFLPIEGVALCEDRIFVPVGHLVYSGRHDIEMVLE